MNDAQENKLSMFIKVSTFLNNNSTALEDVSLIADLETQLNGIIGNITTTAGLISDDTSGYTIDKRNKRTELEEIMLKVSRAAAAYFFSINNAPAFKTADYNKSELHALRDSELYARAKRLHGIVNPIGANLSGFNSSAADVTSLDTKKEAFFAVLQSPQIKRGEKSAAVDDLEDLFVSGDDTLIGLDIYMDTFEAVNANIYNQYQSARSIDNLGGGGGSSETVISTSQNSIAAGAISNPISIPPNAQKARMTVTMLGPLEFGKSVNGTGHDGNTTTLSAPNSTTYTMAEFASSGELMLVKNQNTTLAGAYRIDFLA